MQSQMQEYYRKRVNDYEKIYNRKDKVRLREQKKLAEDIKKFFKKREVIEIAAGTGYWTQFLSETASSIVVSDYVSEALELARQKKYKCPVEFCIEDAYDLSFSDNSFSGGMANFWFSHIPKEKICGFLRGFHRILKNNSVVFIADNNFDERIGGKLIKPKGDINTYKLRTLNDGTSHKILKNYFSKKELFAIFDNFSQDFSDNNLFYGEQFWYVHYTLDKSQPVPKN